MTPKDFFVHVGSMIALYVTAFSLITLLFQAINFAYPDSLNYYSDPYSSGIRWAIACIVIVFPVFLLLSWLISKDFSSNPDKRDLGIRRWLVYLTLFFAGITIITDLVILIDSFLGGEITIRFLLKVVVVLGLVGLVFAYYLMDLKRLIVAKSKLSRVFLFVAIAIVVGSLTVGFSIMGSPAKQRQIRLDQQKVYDLQSIQWRIVSVWQQKGVLPDSLFELNDPISGFVTPSDPQSGIIYDYRKISENSFELCADFNLQNSNDNRSARPIKIGLEFDNQDVWQHTDGRSCFERVIDPELYPVRR